MLAAAYNNTEVVCAKMRTMQSLQLDDAIEDILITLGKQFHHFAQPLGARLVYLSRARQESPNLALARHKAAAWRASLV